MDAIDPQAAALFLGALLEAWDDAVSDPAKAQEEVLHRWLKDYAKTEYGRQHRADKIDTIDDYRRAFPITGYETYKPLIERVTAGEVGLLLWEEAVGWAITRGTTKTRKRRRRMERSPEPTPPSMASELFSVKSNRAWSPPLK